jgi:hypothetical protein
MNADHCAKKIAEYIQGFETDSDEINSRINELAYSFPVFWYGSLLWQVCLLEALDYDTTTFSEDTDDLHAELIQTVSRQLSSTIHVSVPRKSFFGILRKEDKLAPNQVASALTELSMLLTKEFLSQLGKFLETQHLPQSSSFKMRSEDPMVRCVSLAIEAVMCRQLGFAHGVNMAGNLHGALLVCLRNGPINHL